MIAKHSAFDRINRGPLRPALGLLGSAIAGMSGDAGRVKYDPTSSSWIKKSPGGVTLLPYPKGMSAERCDAFLRDVFLPHYGVKRGDVVLDVGAGIGTETLPLSKMVGDSGTIISVEAHPATFATLRRMCDLNRLSNVKLINAAVFDTNTPITISDLPPGHSYENKIGGGGIEVEGVTIATLVTRLNLDRIDFLKMNIEGAEVGALEGAGDALSIVRNAAIGCHDFLVAETGDRSYETRSRVHDLLLKAGFDITTRDDDSRPWAANYLFATR